MLIALLCMHPNSSTSFQRTILSAACGRACCPWSTPAPPAGPTLSASGCCWEAAGTAHQHPTCTLHSPS